MSHPSSPSPGSRRSTEPVNPYAPSIMAEQPVAAAKGGEIAERHYGARLDWTDRQAFLRSVTPSRIGVIALGLLWIKNIYDHMISWNRVMADDGFQFIGKWSVVLGVETILNFAHAALGIYACWLAWKWVDRMQEVAGGRSNSFNGLSRLHLRTEKLWAIVAVMGVLIEGTRMLFSHWLTTGALGGLG